jgi:hypothetical protein
VYQSFADLKDLERELDSLMRKKNKRVK